LLVSELSFKKVYVGLFSGREHFRRMRERSQGKEGGVVTFTLTKFTFNGPFELERMSPAMKPMFGEVEKVGVEDVSFNSR
jgi:hypothetical protein